MVVLLHGYAENSDSWAPLAADLMKDHTAVVPDLRGIGRSSKIRRRDPTEHDVQIEILYCGICHSDLHQVRQECTRFFQGEIQGRAAGAETHP